MLSYKLWILTVLALVFGGKTTLAANTLEHFPSKVIEFPKGSAILSADMRKDISNFITDARAKDRINQVYVAAWADQIRVGDKSLTDTQEELARKRARNIRAYLEDEIKVGDVDTFNMAKRTDLWSRIFNTEESRVKGQKPAGRDRVAWRIQDEGKASAAVLVVETVTGKRVAE